MGGEGGQQAGRTGRHADQVGVQAGLACRLRRREELLIVQSRSAYKWDRCTDWGGIQIRAAYKWGRLAHEMGRRVE